MKQLLGSYFKQVDSSLKPYIADRGYEREFQAENAPFETWKDRRYLRRRPRIPRQSCAGARTTGARHNRLPDRQRRTKASGCVPVLIARSPRRVTKNHPMSNADERCTSISAVITIIIALVAVSLHFVKAVDGMATSATRGSNK